MASGLPNDFKAPPGGCAGLGSSRESSSATPQQLSSAIFQNSSAQASSLVDRVSIANQTETPPANAERQELIRILDAWHPNCPEKEKTRVMQQIIDCYDQGQTFLGLIHSSIDSLPDVFALGGFANLTLFNAFQCNSLTALPESIGNLTGLTSLGLSDCHSLAALPESIGNLRALTSLNLVNCPRLTALPESIGNLTALTELRLRDCSSLRTLPESIGNLRSLTELSLDGCSTLAGLPESIGNLTALTHLILMRCSTLAGLPESIGNLTALEGLYLSGCSSLAALPESIGNLTALKRLYLSRCSSLATLPESVGNLRALIFLDLRGCSSLAALPESIGSSTVLTTLNLNNCRSLTGLPNAILSLPRGCRIDITGCRFSQAIMESLSTSTRADGYRGPQIQYSMQVPRTAAVEQSLAEWLTSTFRNASLQKEALSNLLSLDESNRLTIATWLSRMTDTADANSAGKTGFYQLIVNYLKLANANAEFREVFLQVLHGASTTCGDRVSLSVLHLGIAAKKITCDKKDLKAYAELLKGLIALGLLEEKARAKVQTLRFVDEIEVYLGYPVMLKEALNLPIDIQEMRFFTCSGITPEDLREAEAFVLAHVGAQESLLALLVKNSDWVDALKAKHPTEFASIEAARDAASESDDADYDAIGRVFDQALIDLSRAALA